MGMLGYHIHSRGGGILGVGYRRALHETKASGSYREERPEAKTPDLIDAPSHVVLIIIVGYMRSE